MRYCQSCAAAFDARFKRRALLGQAFDVEGPCEYCGGPGPCAGVASADVVSGYRRPPHGVSKTRQAERRTASFVLGSTW